jgi:hypothetical protein
MGVKKWRKEAEDKSVWGIILQETLFKMNGTYASEEEEEMRQF